MMLLLENIGVVFVISWPPDDRSDKHELLDSKEGRKQKAPIYLPFILCPKSEHINRVIWQNTKSGNGHCQ